MQSGFPPPASGSDSIEHHEDPHKCAKCEVVLSGRQDLLSHIQNCAGHGSFQSNPHQKNPSSEPVAGLLAHALVRNHTDDDVNRESGSKTDILHPLFECRSVTSPASSAIQGISHQPITEPAAWGILKRLLQQPTRNPNDGTTSHQSGEHADKAHHGISHQPVTVPADQGILKLLLQQPARNPHDGTTSYQLGEHAVKARFACRFCPVKFDHEVHLERHQEIHTREGQVGCPQCPKNFRNMNELNRHSLTHTGQRLHECSICHMTFKRKSNLNLHLPTHSSEREDFHCPICDMNFLLKKSLKKHLQSHAHEQLENDDGGNQGNESTIQRM